MIERYIRQYQVFGDDAQEKLLGSHVLVVGAGGLGSPVLYYLAAAGVGNIRIVDGDCVNITNLNRQILFTNDDIGKNKAECAAKRITALNNDVNVEAFSEYIDENNIEEMVSDCDVVVLCVDNRKTRMLVNNVCCEKNIKLVDAGVEYIGGYVVSVIPGKTPCLRCWFGNTDVDKSSSNIFGPAAGIIGSMEALLCMELLMDKCSSNGQMLYFDGILWSFDTINGRRHHKCPACSKLS